MFNKLTDFSYQRTAREACGFYLAYFVLVILVGILVGAFGSLIPQAAYDLGFKLGTFLSVGSAMGLSYLIMLNKKQTQNFRFILLTVIAGILGMLGTFLGLIIPAYLTTQKGRIKGKAKK